MLELASQRWAELNHAYGSAADIPALLTRLRTVPPSNDQAEPWPTLWSALAHQGEVYSASFAAVPHVVDALGREPLKADGSYFQFPAWVEICRRRKHVEVPEDLSSAYFESLARLPSLVAAASGRPWDPDLLGCALAAIAVAKGQPEIAEAVLEVSSQETAREFLNWRLSQ